MPWKGESEGGSIVYSVEQQVAVVNAFLAHKGPAQGIVLSELADQLYLRGRTLRKILSDRDGIDFLVGYDGGRVFCATKSEEGTMLTHRLQSQMDAMRERVRRRVTAMGRMLEGDSLWPTCKTPPGT